MKKLLLIFGIGVISSFQAKAQFPAPYCSDTFQYDTEPITLVNFAGINNTSSNVVNGSPDMQDFTSMTGNVVIGSTYPIVLKGHTGGSYTNYFSVFVDWNQDNDFSDAGEKFNIGTIYNSNGIDAVQATGNITVPAGALTGTTRMRVHKLYGGYPTGPCTNTGGYGQIEDYTLSITAPPDCSGTPTAGTVSGPANICPGVAFTLTLTGTTTGVAGIGIQWQSSPDGTTWANIPGATATTYGATISDTTYYQAIVTCNISGLSDTSNMLTVNTNAFYACYCTPPHTSATSCIGNVTFGTINNNSVGCSLPSYTAYPAATATTDLVQGSNVPISVTTLSGLNAIISVWIDFNQNGIYETTEWTQVATNNPPGVPATVMVNIPAGALLGQTGMRVRTRETGNPNGATNACTSFGSGETEDYVVNIIAATPCTGTPTAGATISTLPSVCGGQTFTLNIDNPPTGYSDISYQWQSSPDGTTWTNIPGATSQFYTTTQTADTYYQLIVTCDLSTESTNSTPLEVEMNPFYTCYCNTSLAAFTADTKIDSVSIGGVSTGSLAGTCESYTNYTSVTGIDLNILAGNTLKVRNGSCSGSHYTAYLAVYIDYNQDGDYTDPGEQVATYGPTTGLNTIPVLNIVPPITALGGTTGMRIILSESGAPLAPCAGYNYGETEDYIVNLIPPVTCSGAPDAGITTATESNVCTGESSVLGTSGGTIASDFTYQWLESADNITWSAIASATGPTYTATPADTMYYQVVVTCPTSGMSDTSASVPVYFNPWYMCLCEPTYTTGTAEGDYIGMVMIETINNVTGGAPLPGYTFYATPGASLSQGTDYTLTVAAGTYGTNDLAAWIDFDQNGTFDPSEKIGETNDLGSYPATDSYVFTVPAGAALGNTVLRVREIYAGAPGIDPCASATYGETEDYLITIIPIPPCVNPPVGGVVSGPAIDSIGNMVTYVVTGEEGDSYQWYSSSDSVTFTPVPGSNNDTLTVTLNGSGTVYYMVVMSSPGCVKDSSNVFATDIIYNDDVCMAFPLQIGMNGPYSTATATVQPGEMAPAGGDCISQNTWCNNTLNGTLWFTLVAPPSGRVTIHSPGFDTQLALWKANSCSDLLDNTAVLVAANDDDTLNVDHGGASFSSFINGIGYCLEPGTTYYVQLDAYSSPGTTPIIVTDLGFPTSPTVDLQDSVFCDSLVLTAGSIPGLTYLWSDGSTDQTATFTSSGTVSVTVTDSIGCKATDMATITNDTPLASFSSSSPGMGVFNFTNTSTPSSIFGYSWNFGDGGTSTLEDPAHTYTFNGVFIVTLTVTNACGTDAISQTVTVTGIGVTELTTDNTVKVYPNPASDLLNIISDASINEISIVNTAGQVVFNMNNVNSSKTQLDLGALVSGMYMVNVQTEKGTARTQISIMK